MTAAVDQRLMATFDQKRPHIVAFDSETWLIAPGRRAPRLVCMTARSSREALPFLVDSTRKDIIRKSVELWLRDSKTILVGHNMAYDMGVMVQEWPDLLPLVWKAYDDGQVFDTGIIRMLHNIARGWSDYDPTINRPPDYSLAGLGMTYFGEALEGKHGPDVWRNRYRELDGIPRDQWPQAAVDYALGDADMTYRVFQTQLSEGLPPDVLPQCRAAWALHLMGAWGIRTDGQAVAELEARLEESIERAMVPLREAGIYRQRRKGGKWSQNKKRTQQLVAEAYERLGQSPPTTDKGNIKTDKETCWDSGDPLLEKLAFLSADQTEMSNFMPSLKAGVKWPINPRWRVLVSTGRTSCGKPNLQNQPRRNGVRECFIPRPGNVFIACDYATIELRALAQVLLWKYGHSEMANALLAGRDLHKVTGAMLLGISYEEFERRYKAGDPQAKEARQLSKAINFGFPGGLGPATFISFSRAQTMDAEGNVPAYIEALDEDTVRGHKEAWLGRYPEMEEYFRDAGRTTSEHGGRAPAEQYVSGRIRGNCTYTALCNTYFQGLVADGAKRALYAVQRECYSPLCTINGCDGLAGSHVDSDAGLSIMCSGRSALFGFRAVAFIHDEIIIEGPEHRAHEAAKRLEAVMSAEMARYIPDIPVPAEAEVMRRWSKDAEPVTGPHGRLIPWEDRDNVRAA